MHLINTEQGKRPHHHTQLPKDIFALLSNRILLRIGFGLLGVFMPIFFFRAFESSVSDPFLAVLAVYAFLYLSNIFFIPIGAMFLSRMGIRKLIAVAIPFASIAIASLYFFDSHPILITIFYTISVSLYSALYWIPYYVDLSHFLDTHAMGKQLSAYKNILQIVAVITPVLSGFLITMFGFSNVFIFSAIALMFGLFPVKYIHEVYEKYSWGYFETYRQLFKRKHAALFFAYAADGAQVVVSGVIWPIFIFSILDERFTAVGLVTSLTIIVIMALQSVVGKLVDKLGEDKVLKYGTVLAMTGWILKAFVETAFQVFITDTYHRFGRAVNRLSFDAATYQHSADSGHYIDEYTALKEIALRIGRVSMLGFAALLIIVFDNIRIVFLTAALATIVVSYLNQKIKL